MKLHPAGIALSLIALLAGVATMAHRVGINTGKVKYIHVVGSNTSCDGVHHTALSQPNTSSSSTPAATPSSSAAASAAAEVPASSAGLLQFILPHTNFSALTTAQLLDSALAAKTPVRQLQPLMQLHQQLWCSSKMHLQPLANSTAVKFRNVSIYVYANNDIVSNQLRGNGHSWEHTEIKEMLWAVRQYWKQSDVMKYLPAKTQVAAAGQGHLSRRHLQQHRAGSRQLKASSQPSRPLMIDVGSNVGWFAINAAAAGARVAAFEAMASNLALLRRSYCANPRLAERTALFGTGLGTESTSCGIVSGEDNKGDGIVMCGSDPEQVLKDKGWNTTQYKVRGGITIRRLDTLIQEDVQVMKMDVEGFELNVLKGAEGLLKSHTVWYIMLECNKDLIGGAKGQLEYLRYLDELGYAISTYGFSGPFLDAKLIKDGSIRIVAMNLYCVRKDLRQAQLAHKAGVTAAATATAKKQP